MVLVTELTQTASEPCVLSTPRICLHQTRLSREASPRLTGRLKLSQNCGLGISQFHTHVGFPRLPYLPTLPWHTHLGAVLVGWGRDILRGHHCQSWGWGGMLHHGIDSHGGSVGRREGAAQLVQSPGSPRANQFYIFFSNLEHLELMGYTGTGCRFFRGINQNYGKGPGERSLPCYFDSKETIFKLQCNQCVPLP